MVVGRTSWLEGSSPISIPFDPAALCVFDARRARQTREKHSAMNVCSTVGSTIHWTTLEQSRKQWNVLGILKAAGMPRVGAGPLCVLRNRSHVLRTVPRQGWTCRLIEGKFRHFHVRDIFVRSSLEPSLFWLLMPGNTELVMMIIR
jgi:hypothetical protein